MKTISILNGTPSNGNVSINSYLANFKNALSPYNINVEIFNLRDLNIIPCAGCWGCWVKNPGECAFKDDTKIIRKKVINSDWLIFASPLIMGFTSAVLKKTQDKLIPLLLPYVKLVNDECHHYKRYNSYPNIGLIYETESDTDEEDIRIITDIYKRFALNFKSELKFIKSIDESFEPTINEIINN